MAISIARACFTTRCSLLKKRTVVVYPVGGPRVVPTLRLAQREKGGRDGFFEGG